MPANSGLPDNPQRISFVCDCGKKLVANSMQSGKRLKCPSCGQVVVVPPVRAGIVPTPTRAASEPHTADGQSAVDERSVVDRSLVAARRRCHRRRRFYSLRRKIETTGANRRCQYRSEGGSQRGRWLAQAGERKEGENVEHRLMKAIAANDVSEKVNADADLEAVLTRRAELAADALFDSAKTKLDAKAIVEAVALLQRYVADPHATKKPEAEQLLADYDLATSESAAIETLIAMSDEQFVQFRITGILDDHKIVHPVCGDLRQRCGETWKRPIGAAKKRSLPKRSFKKKKPRLPKRIVKSRNALLSRPPTPVSASPVPPTPMAPRSHDK